MTRRIWLSIMAGIFVLAMMASPVAVGADKEVTITFWHGWSGARHPLVRGILDRFEAEHPGIKVVDQLVPVAQLTDKLVVGWTTGVGPDVAMLDFPRQLAFGADGYLLPLEPLAEKDGTPIKELIYPSVAEMILWDGTTYYLPQLIDADFLYYNGDMFAQAGLDPTSPPKTHSELREVAKTLTRYSSGGQIDVLGLDVLSHGSLNYFNFKAYLDQYARAFVDASRRTVFPDFETTVDVAEWMLDLAADITGDAAAGPSFVQANGGWLQAFLNAKTAMHTSFDYVYFQVKAQNAEHPIGIAVRPHPDDQPYRTTTTPSWGYGISQSTHHPEAAWKLLKWLSATPEGGGEFVRSQSRLSTSAEINGDPVNFEVNPYWPVFIQAVEQSGFWGYRSYGNLEPQFQSLIAEAFNEAARGSQSISSGLLNVRGQLQAQLDQWWSERQ